MTAGLDYRPYEGVYLPPWRRIWPVAHRELLSLFRSRWGVALFFVCLFPTIGRLVMLLIVFGVVNLGPRALQTRLAAPPTPELAALHPAHAAFYLEPVLAVMPGMIAFLLVSCLVVARSVARDRGTNALELYWTRGISPGAYLFGKWLGGFLLLSVFTVLSPFSLWVVASLLAEDWSLLTDTAGTMGLGLVALALVTAVWSAAGTMLSLASASANVAMVLWCILLVGTSALGAVLGRALREPSLAAAVSFWEAGGVAVRAIAGLTQRGAAPGWASVSLLVVLLVLSIAGLRRLRLQEAVA